MEGTSNAITPPLRHRPIKTAAVNAQMENRSSPQSPHQSPSSALSTGISSSASASASATASETTFPRPQQHQQQHHRLAPFNPTDATAQRAALSLLSLTPDDVLFDLGCGDGRFLLTAARSVPTGLRCVGIECDPRHASRAMENLRGEPADVADRVDVVLGDTMDHEERIAAEATAVFLYLVPEGLEIVGPMLRRVLLAKRKAGSETNSTEDGPRPQLRQKGQLRVASYVFAVPGWESHLTKVVRDTKGGLAVYFYDFRR